MGNSNLSIALVVADWIYASFSTPEQLLVTGCSAGAYGSAMWSAHVAEHYPTARVAQLGDSGAGIITSSFFEASFPKWNATPVLPARIKGLDPSVIDALDMVALYSELVNYYAEASFAQYNSAFDSTQAFYFKVMGGGGPDEWSAKMLASMDSIEAKAPRFSSFIASGDQHCILGFDNFYTVSVGETTFVDWFERLSNGEKVADLRCTDCSAPTP
ncbi:MAG: hypothetical protein EXR75_10905 [Myxococcales bacterium]|nr:hypothetical protein [Myxococcales bacterium]